MLAILQNVPKNDFDWEIWAFNNREHISEITQAIKAQHNVNLPEYQLYPINFNRFSEWLERKSQAHTDFNGVLGLQSSDLKEMDPKNEKQLSSWVYLQYQELFNASAELKI